MRRHFSIDSCWGRLAGLILAVLAIAVADASPAAAHAAFVASDPEPGSRLVAGPGVVTLRFSEPLIAGLSSASVTDPTGRRFEGRVAGERHLEVPLPTNAPGVYEVEWRTVSPLDGHTLRGSFRFGVGAEPGAGAEGHPSAAPTRADLLLAVVRWVEYAGLLAAVGSLTLTSLARVEPELGWVNAKPWVPLTVALGAGTSVVAGEVFLAARNVSGVVTYLTGGVGVVRLLRLAWVAVSLVALRIRHRRATIAAVVGAVLALAAAGHAAAVEPAWWGVGVDAVHLLAAGVWAGGIVSLMSVRPPGGWRADAGRALLSRFSRVALPAFVVTVAFGTLRGVQELAGPGDLAGSGYGQVLLLKVVTVSAMVPLSLRAWRGRLPRPRLEAALGALVMALAAVLAAFPVPPGRAEAEGGEATESSLSALSEPADLTLGGGAGDVLVGVTLRPARPGPNQLSVYLAPVAGVPAGDRSVLVHVDGEAYRVESCGANCRRTEAPLTGGEQVEVRVSGADGGTALFRLPPLPAEPAAALLEHATARMKSLRTYRIDEVLGPVDPPLEADWELQAPNRLHFTVEGGVETVRIGTTRYTRPRPGAQWEIERNAPPVAVPTLIWDYPGARGVHVVGRELLGEEPVVVMSFFIDVNGNPIWYRLWVDDEASVRRAEMRAKGHFMDHDYGAFNEDFVVDAPRIRGGVD